MRKLVAAVTFVLAIVLFATAGWNRFQHRYCNAQRLNQELADSANPARLAADIEQDQEHEQEEFRQLMLGGGLFFVSIVLWTGRVYPQRLVARYRRHAITH